MSLRDSSRICGSVQDLVRLDGLSDQVNRVLFVSDRTLYLLANFASDDVQRLARYAKEFIGGDFFFSVDLEDTTEVALVGDIANAFGLEVIPVTIIDPRKLLGVRGYWPMSAIDYTANLFDQSGNVRTLTKNGTLTYNHDDIGPYADFAGGYLSRANELGLGITGTETFFASDKRGMTLGGWFYFNNAPGSTEGMMCKDNGAADRSFGLRRDTAGAARMLISNTGSAVFQVGSTVMAATGWYFVVGRFDPSTELAIFIGSESTGVMVKEVNTTSIPASIFISNQPLIIGGQTATTFPMSGRIASPWLSAAYLSDDLITGLFRQGRAWG